MRLLKTFFIPATAFMLTYIQPGFAQAVDPASTVNPVNGQMQLSIPLGTVQGVGGNDYPITISYNGGGIQTFQEASPAGLGFSYGPGGITRKVVFVPDENTGGNGNYYQDFSGFENVACEKPWWLGLRAALAGSGFLALLFQPPTNEPLTCIASSWLGQKAGSMFSKDMSSLLFNPGNLISGDGNTPGYSKTANGQGFLRGSSDDIPDLYFVNTPYISGVIMWNPGNGSVEDGNFVFKQSGGSSIKGSESIKVRYALDEGVEGAYTFDIVLQNGTTLVFDLLQRSNSYTKMFWRYKLGETRCEADAMVLQKERIPVQWFLTKVLPVDYVDGDGDRDPATNPELDKGAWIRFEYQKTGGDAIVYARRLPDAYQMDGSRTRVSSPGTNGSDPAYPNSCIFEEYFLRRVRTPIQIASYTYTFDRKDDLWFPEENMVWEKEAVGQAPAAARIAAVSSGPEIAQPVARPVLSCIYTYNYTNRLVQKINFTTDYSLRPGSFHSYSKDKSGEFRVVDATANEFAGCLTLKKITTENRSANTLPPVIFNYNNDKNFPQWDKEQVSEPQDGDPTGRMKFYIERRDYWGNYVNNTSTTNDFNKDGLAALAADVDAWLLKEVLLPSGMKIGWEYEPHRYDAANGYPVKGEHVSGDDYKPVKYGGGVRVKKIAVNDGIGNNYSRSYFYTDEEGVFDETEENSSGHVSVEPNPYLLNPINDLRNQNARGGNYAQSSVMYEMVQVVNNYNKSAIVPCPEGYTVYEFITPKDFPNTGLSGATDYSWKRGLLSSLSVYNKDGIQLSVKRNEYEFVEQHNFETVAYQGGIFNANYGALLNNPCGWVKIKKNQSNSIGVKNENEVKYASDLSTITDDDISNTIDKIVVEEIGRNIDDLNQPQTQMEDCALTVITPTIPNTDQSMEDIILLRTFWSNWLEIQIGADFSVLNENPLQNIWTENFQVELPCIGQQGLLGADVYKMPDGDNIDDLIVVTGGYNNAPYFNVIVIHNISIEENINGNKILNHSGITKTCVNVNPAPTEQDEMAVGCIIGNINSDQNNHPDFIFTANYASPSFYLPGDIIGSSSPGRKMFAVIDFEENDLNIIEKNVFKTSGFYDYFGNIGFLTNADNDINGVKNDLVISGNGCVDATGGNNSHLLDRPLYFQKFFNIDLNGTELRFLGGAEYCRNCEDYIEIQNIRAAGEGVWASTKFSGVIQENMNTIPRFIYFSQRERPYLYIVRKQPTTQVGDYDGQPNRIITSNSDGTKIISEKTPAYWYYPAMGNYNYTDNHHILSLTCGETTYRFPKDATIPDDLATHTDKVISAKAVIWADFNGAWLPSANYIWRVPMENTGLPQVAFTQFQYTAPSSSDTAWKMTDSIIRYSPYSMPEEIAIPNKNDDFVYKSTIYNSGAFYPIGGVKGAKWKECGIFTCDYNLDEQGTPYNYFDKNNGWEIGVSASSPNPPTGTVSNEAPHFGQKSLHVENGEGLMRCFKIRGGVEYQLSFWAKIISGTMPIRVEYRKETAPITDWPVPYNHTSLTDPVTTIVEQKGTTDGIWRLFKISVPSTSGNDNWIRISIGFHDATFNAFMDDVRFAPVDAMATVTYYDTLWNKPVMNVDANNNPTNKTTYDNFGRPSYWAKIDPTKDEKMAEYETKIIEKNYSAMRDGIVIREPVGGQGNSCLLPLEIDWENERGYDVEIVLLKGDAVVRTIDNITHTPGTITYEKSWTIPGDIAEGDDYSVKIIDFGGSGVFDRSGLFTIKKGVVITPKEGDHYETGKTMNIVYVVAADASASVAIFANVEGVRTLISGAGETNTGSFKWYIPKSFTISNNVTIEIECNGFTIESGVFALFKGSNFIRKWILNLLGIQ